MVNRDSHRSGGDVANLFAKPAEIANGRKIRHNVAQSPAIAPKLQKWAAEGDLLSAFRAQRA
jgi:hypothetical protein